MSYTDKGRELKTAERKVKVLELCKSGASTRTIAAHLKEQGVKCSKSTVARDINEALQKLSEEEVRQAEQLRTLELGRIDALWLAHWTFGLQANIASSWFLLALSKQRCELLNLYPAKKIEVKVDPREGLAKLLGISPDQLPEPKNAKS